MSEWIKCSERLPEHKQFVLAYGDPCQGWVSGPKISVFYWDQEWWDANMDCEKPESQSVTHWQPLPTPPTEGE